MLGDMKKNKGWLRGERIVRGFILMEWRWKDFEEVSRG